MIQLILVAKIAYYYCLIITYMVYLFRQGLGTQNVKEMQLLRDSPSIYPHMTLCVVPCNNPEFHIECTHSAGGVHKQTKMAQTAL